MCCPACLTWTRNLVGAETTVDPEWTDVWCIVVVGCTMTIYPPSRSIWYPDCGRFDCLVQNTQRRWIRQRRWIKTWDMNHALHNKPTFLQVEYSLRLLISRFIIEMVNVIISINRPTVHMTNLSECQVAQTLMFVMYPRRKKHRSLCQQKKSYSRSENILEIKHLLDVVHLFLPRVFGRLSVLLSHGGVSGIPGENVAFPRFRLHSHSLTHRRDPTRVGSRL